MPSKKYASPRGGTKTAANSIPRIAESVEDADPTIRLSISVTKSFAKKLQKLADKLQGAKPGKGNVSLLLRSMAIQTHATEFQDI